MSHKMNTLILAVPAKGARWVEPSQGFRRFIGGAVYTMLALAGPVLAKRGFLETNPAFRQVIPYVVLRKGDCFAAYTRGVAGGEERLHGKISIGVGGHIDIDDIYYTFAAVGNSPVDVHWADTVRTAAERELNEEVSMARKPSLGLPLGFIVDDSDEVGQVHLGILYIVDIPEEVKVVSNEPEITDIQWLTAPELLSQSDRLETWTRLVLEAL